MRAGRLRRRVSVQTPVQSLDSYGQPTVTWTEVAQVWAEIKPMRGDEPIRSRVVQGEVTHRITIRYTTDLPGPECRIVYGTRQFNVLERLNFDEMGRELDILAKELV